MLEHEKPSASFVAVFLLTPLRKIFSPAKILVSEGLRRPREIKNLAKSEGAKSECAKSECAILTALSPRPARSRQVARLVEVAA